MKKTKLFFLTRDKSHQLSIIQYQKINIVRLLVFALISKTSYKNDYSIRFKSQMTGFIIKLSSTLANTSLIVLSSYLSQN